MKKPTLVSSRVKLKLAPSAGVVKKLCSSRSIVPSVAMSAAARHLQRAVFSGAY